MIIFYGISLPLFLLFLCQNNSNDHCGNNNDRDYRDPDRESVLTVIGGLIGSGLFGAGGRGNRIVLPVGGCAVIGLFGIAGLGLCRL